MEKLKTFWGKGGGSPHDQAKYKKPPALQGLLLQKAFRE
jgi:hypothetical protein